MALDLAVQYYAYGALGTDTRPPFTLAEVPDYPAHFQVAYPEHLSRGLVLVKWWLLALPHHVIVGVPASASGWWRQPSASRATRRTDRNSPPQSPHLVMPRHHIRS